MKIFAYLSLILALSSCAPQTFIAPDSANSTPITSASIVSLIKPYITSDSEGVANGIGTYEYCEAFCVKDVDQPYLVTAAHCVEGLASGSVFQYNEPNGIGIGNAVLEWIGRTGDRAIASI